MTPKSIINRLASLWMAIGETIIFINIYSYQLKLTAARLKNGTAQGFRLANSARIFFNLSWYDYTLSVIADF